MNYGAPRVFTPIRCLKLFLQTLPLVVTIVLANGRALAKDDLTVSAEGGPSNGDASVSYAIDMAISATSSIQLVPSADDLYYDAHQGGAKTKTQSPGASLGLQYSYSGDSLTFDIGPAIDATWQQRKAAGATKGFSLVENSTLAGPGANADLTYDFTEATIFDLSASYEQPDRFYWTRADLEMRIVHARSFSILVGPEGSLQGNDLLHQTGGGVVTEFAFDNSGTSLQLRGGYAEVTYTDHTNSSGPYVGVTLDQHV